MNFDARNMRFHRRYFIAAMLLLFTEVIIARYFHDKFIRPFVGDFLVVILIYCMVCSFLKLHTMAAAAGVLLFAYAIEISQYYHLINMLGLEHSTIAQMILGTSFSWIDILMYTLGIIAVIILEILPCKLAQATG